MAPSQYLNQCWLHICEILWHSHVSNFTVSAQATILYDDFENDTFKSTAISPKVHSVNALIAMVIPWFTMPHKESQFSPLQPIMYGQSREKVLLSPELMPLVLSVHLPIFP